MKVSRKQHKLVKEALESWVKAGKITAEKKEELEASLEPSPFDWKLFSKYCFWVALASFVISFVAFLADQALLKLLDEWFNSSAAVKMLVCAGFAALFYFLGFRGHKKRFEMYYRNEALFFLGVVGTLFFVKYFGDVMGGASRYLSLLSLLSFAIYAVLALSFRSALIWVFALLALGGWLGFQTGYLSGWGSYYLGMNYPLRFVLFGGLLTVFSFWIPTLKPIKHFYKPTLVVSLLYFFVAFWLLSIFGNYGDEFSWSRVKQIELLHWSFLMGLASFGAVYHGVRFENAITKGFGLTFLFINLYTRFFEYYWSSLHGGVFFAVLGFSFWWLASKAESIWSLKAGKSKP